MLKKVFLVVKCLMSHACWGRSPGDLGKVLLFFGEGLFLCLGPSPRKWPQRPLNGRNAGEGVGPKMRPSPKTTRTFPKISPPPRITRLRSHPRTPMCLHCAYICGPSPQVILSMFIYLANLLQHLRRPRLGARELVAAVACGRGGEEGLGQVVQGHGASFGEREEGIALHGLYDGQHTS